MSKSLEEEKFENYYVMGRVLICKRSIMSWVLLLEVMLCIVVVGMLCLSIREGEANVVSCCGMLCCVKKETQKI